MHIHPDPQFPQPYDPYHFYDPNTSNTLFEEGDQLPKFYKSFWDAVAGEVVSELRAGLVNPNDYDLLKIGKRVIGKYSEPDGPAIFFRHPSIGINLDKFWGIAQDHEIKDYEEDVTEPQDEVPDYENDEAVS